MHNQSKIHLAIADDHEIFRQGFKALIARQSGLEMVGEAGNGKDLIDLVFRLQPNLLFVDIKMPIMDGIDATQVELISAINAVMSGGSYFCRDTSERISALVETSYFYPAKRNLRIRFSDREINVIQLICEQYTTKEIANKLGLSNRTIDAYRDTIQQKTNSKNMVGISLFAVKNGIFKLEL